LNFIFNLKINLKKPVLFMQVVWSYVKELVDSFFDDNLKKIWAMFKGTLKTLFTILINPCYPFPLPKKHLLDEMRKIEETDDLQKAGKDGFLNDINFTKNAILIMLTLVVGDAVTSTATQEDTNIVKVLSVLFYLVGFFVFLGIGRLWFVLFGNEKLNSRKVDGWFSFEYNMLFLLFFMADYLASNAFGMKDVSDISLYMMVFVLIHIIYFMICLQKETKKQVGTVYYWGINVFLVLILFSSSVFGSILQIVLKEDLQKPKTEKKIETEEKTKPKTEKKIETEEETKPETEEKTAE
jgi:hypothetical protein